MARQRRAGRRAGRRTSRRIAWWRVASEEWHREHSDPPGRVAHVLKRGIHAGELVQRWRRRGQRAGDSYPIARGPRPSRGDLAEDRHFERDGDRVIPLRHVVEPGDGAVEEQTAASAGDDQRVHRPGASVERIEVGPDAESREGDQQSRPDAAVGLPSPGPGVRLELDSERSDDWIADRAGRREPGLGHFGRVSPTAEGRRRCAGRPTPGPRLTKGSRPPSVHGGP